MPPTAAATTGFFVDANAANVTQGVVFLDGTTAPISVAARARVPIARFHPAHTCVCVCECVRASMRVCVCEYVCACVYVCVCMHMCECVYMRGCIHVCVYA